MRHLLTIDKTKKTPDEYEFMVVGCSKVILVPPVTLEVSGLAKCRNKKVNFYIPDVDSGDGKKKLIIEVEGEVR